MGAAAGAADAAAAASRAADGRSNGVAARGRGDGSSRVGRTHARRSSKQLFSPVLVREPARVARARGRRRGGAPRGRRCRRLAGGRGRRDLGGRRARLASQAERGRPARETGPCAGPRGRRAPPRAPPPASPRPRPARARPPSRAREARGARRERAQARRLVGADGRARGGTGASAASFEILSLRRPAAIACATTARASRTSAAARPAPAPAPCRRRPSPCGPSPPWSWRIRRRRPPRRPARLLAGLLALERVRLALERLDVLLQLAQLGASTAPTPRRVSAPSARPAVSSAVWRLGGIAPGTTAARRPRSPSTGR